MSILGARRRCGDDGGVTEARGARSEVLGVFRRFRRNAVRWMLCEKHDGLEGKGSTDMYIREDEDTGVAA